MYTLSIAGDTGHNPGGSDKTCAMQINYLLSGPLKGADK